MFVIDSNGNVKGHFVDSDGTMQVTTDEYGVITAWREGIDTVPVPFTCGAEKAPEPDWLKLEESATSEHERRTLSKAQKLVVEEEEPDFRYARYGTGHAKIRVLIYYDSTMADYIERLADFLIEITNDAFLDSIVPVSLELAGIKPIELDDLVPNSDVLSAMQASDTPYESIEEDRRQHSADLTATLRDAEDGQAEQSCGIASIGGKFRVSKPSVTRYTRYRAGEPFFPDYCFAHEIGHNLGANHARWQFTEDEMIGNSYNFTYAYGYFIEGLGTTIMSYGKEGISRPILIQTLRSFIRVNQVVCFLIKLSRQMSVALFGTTDMWRLKVMASHQSYCERALMFPNLTVERN